MEAGLTFIADILLGAGAIGAAFYCMVLGRRLRAFNDLEKGMGGAVAVLSAQVDDLEKTLNLARSTASASTDELHAVAARAEDVRRQLEMQMAALHDLVPVETKAETAPVQTPSTTEKPEDFAQTPPVEQFETELTPVVDEPPTPLFIRRRRKVG